MSSGKSPTSSGCVSMNRCLAGRVGCWCWCSCQPAEVVWSKVKNDARSELPSRSVVCFSFLSSSEDGNAATIGTRGDSPDCSLICFFSLLRWLRAFPKVSEASLLGFFSSSTINLPLFLSLSSRRRATLAFDEERYRSWSKSRKTYPTFSLHAWPSHSHQRPSICLTNAPVGHASLTMSTSRETTAVLSILFVHCLYCGRSVTARTRSRRLPTASVHALPLPITTE